MAYQVRVTWAAIEYTASGPVPVVERIPIHVGNAVAGGPQGASVSQNIQIETGKGNAVANGKTVDITSTVSGTPPKIQTTTIYTGKVGTLYASALTATGDKPITWSLISGSLPPGLTLNSDGSITGTPTTQGTYTFTVRASNGAGQEIRSVTGGIDAADLPPPTIDVPHAVRPASLDGCWAAWSEQQQQNLLRTQMDSGAIKVRRRTTGIARVAQVSVSMPAEKYAAFMSWYNVNCQQGVLPTLMCTPQCNEELWRFVEAPQITWVSKEVFTASATIERQPGW